MNPILHRAMGLLLLPLLVILSWSGTLSLYRAELDLWLTPALQQTQSAPLPLAQLDGFDPGKPVSTEDINSTEVHNSNTAVKRVMTLSPVPVLESVTEQARQFALALQYQQQVAPQAAALYLEFASTRKPYLTVHLRQAGSWQLQQNWLAVADGQPLAALQTVQPGPSQQQVGSWFFSLHYQLLGFLGRYGQTVALIVAFTALWLSLAGVWLWWWRRRQVAAPALLWHQWLGVLSLPWLGWFFGSALFTQFGNWQPDLAQHAGLSPAQYYAALYPQPAVVAPAALPADLAAAAVTVLGQANWPVGKIQLDYESRRFLLTQDVASQLGSEFAQLQQQSFSLQGTALPQGAYSSQPVWQLRNWFYALHQAAFAGPNLRLWLFMWGCGFVLMLLAGAESLGRRLGCLWLMRSCTSGFVLASLVFVGAVFFWPGYALLPLFSACWALAIICCKPDGYRLCNTR